MVYKIKNNGLCNVINVDFNATNGRATPPEHVGTTNLLVQMTETHVVHLVGVRRRILWLRMKSADAEAQANYSLFAS